MACGLPWAKPKNGLLPRISRETLSVPSLIVGISPAGADAARASAVRNAATAAVIAADSLRNWRRVVGRVIGFSPSFHHSIVAVRSRERLVSEPSVLDAFADLDPLAHVVDHADAGMPVAAADWRSVSLETLRQSGMPRNRPPTRAAPPSRSTR